MLWRDMRKEVMRCHTQSRVFSGVFFSLSPQEESKADRSYSCYKEDRMCSPYALCSPSEFQTFYFCSRATDHH